MTESIKTRARLAAPAALVVVIALLVIGTLTNQVRINHTQAEIRTQAANGQKALNRQCRLVPISRKIYGDELARGKITRADYETVLGTAARVCPPRPKP